MVMKYAWSICFSLFFLTLFCGFSVADYPTLQIGINADFSNGQMLVAGVIPNGPATKMSSKTVPQASLEVGDAITKVNGVAVRSHSDFVSAVNRSLDGNMTIHVRDVNSGQVLEWNLFAKPTATTEYGILRDTYRRGIRTDSVGVQASNPCEVNLAGKTVTDRLPSFLPTIKQLPDQVSSEERLRQIVMSIQAIHESQLVSKTPVFSDDTFLKIDRIIKPYFQRINTAKDEKYKRSQVIAVREEVLASITNDLNAWASTNKIRVVHAVSAPYRPPFRVKTSRPVTRVELLKVADMVSLVLKTGRNPRQLDKETIELIGNSNGDWLPLDNEQAYAFGNYYYRFVESKNGKLETTPFNPLMKKKIINPKTAKSFSTGELDCGFKALVHRWLAEKGSGG